jgi:osmotically-inducible protein OsmY
MLSMRFAIVVAVTLGLTQTSVAAPQTSVNQTPDSAIVAAVKRALSGQSDLRKLAVSVDGSQVKLTGRVPTLWLKMDAVKRTLKVDGVKTILSEIELPKGESDANLAAALGRAIDGYPYYTVFDYIDATIRQGVVTLIGSVTPDMNKSDDIAEAVAKVRGVQEIRNQIVTLPTQQGDDDIRSTLYSRITGDTNFEGVPIDRRPPFHIIVDHGVVTLYGWVQGEIEYRKLESIARSTSGVLRVNNNLKTLTKIKR